MAKGKGRKRIPAPEETEVLARSRRKCCLCAHHELRFDVRPGQIHHIDGDPKNHRLENLVWLCLEHHDKCQSSSPIAKGYTKREIKTLRDRLYETLDQLERVKIEKLRAES